MAMQKIILSFLAVLLVGVLAFRLFPTSVRQTAEPITIGVAFAQSGVADEWGEGALHVVDLYVNKLNGKGGINGHLIKLIVEDTRSTNVGTVNAVSKLINVDNVPVILGPTWADSFQGALPIAEKAKVVLMSADTSIDVAESEKNFDYFFSTFWPQASEVGALEGYLIDHKLSRIAVVTDKDPFDVGMGQAFKQDALEKGMAIISYDELPIGQADFRTTLVKLRAEHLEAVIFFFQDPATVGPFAKQAHELGLTVPMLSGSSTQNNGLVQKFGPVLNGVYYSYPAESTEESYRSLVKEYKATYGDLPAIPSLPNTYNAVHAVTATLEKGARTGEEIKDALYRLKTSGIGVKELSFTSRGQVANVPFTIKTIREGQFVETK